jgi:hypothetical protein
MLKRKVSCTFKRKITLEIQERIYRLFGPAGREPIHGKSRNVEPRTLRYKSSISNYKSQISTQQAGGEDTAATDICRNQEPQSQIADQEAWTVWCVEAFFGTRTASIRTQPTTEATIRVTIMPVSAETWEKSPAMEPPTKLPRNCMLL